MEITINEVHFESIVKACEYFNVRYLSVVRKAKRDGISYEEAISYYISNRKESILVNGIEFKSVTDACQYFGVKYSSVFAKVRMSGITIEDAINYYIDKKGETVKIKEVDFKSLREACEYFGVNYSSVLRKVSVDEISVDEAIDYYITHGKGKIPSKGSINKSFIIINGERFKSLTDACQYFGVNYGSVSMKSSKEGISYEDAINYYISKKENNVNINGVLFKSLREACNYYDVDYEKVVHKSYKSSISHEEAINYIIARNNTDSSVLVNDICFDSVSSACRYFDVSLTSVRRFIQEKSFTCEDAINYCLKPVEVNGVLEKTNWNQRVKGLKIVAFLGRDMYKCDNNGVVRYYTKDELLRKYEELKGVYRI